MQMKKFEARTMKEALEMVKSQLGPDAIILSAREISKGFGLGGVKSIEITAAYSQQVLTAKKAIESKFTEKDKIRFGQSSAKTQKEIMQKIIEEKIRKENEKKDLHRTNTVSTAFSQPKKTILPKQYSSQTRYIEIEDESNKVKSETESTLTLKTKKEWESMEVSSLKKEIDSLRQLVSQFSEMPKNFSQSHPGAEFGINYKLSGKFIELTQSGLLPEVAGDILKRAQKELNFEQQQKDQIVEGWIAQDILNSIDCSDINEGFFHLFWGPSGSGKTTALIKYASYLVLSRNKRVAIISTDTIKIGADEQMKVFSQILNIPFVMVRNQHDWNMLAPYLDQVDHVLVDFSSTSLKNDFDIQRLQSLIPNNNQNAYTIKRHLVLSATAKDMDLLEVEHRYRNLGYDDTLFTFLDEARQHGTILNYSKKTNSEFFAFSIGPKVPEDFERATPERVLDLILKLTQRTAIRQQESGL